MENLFQLHFNDFNALPPVLPDSSDYCEEVIQEGKKYHHCTFPNCGKIFRFKSEFMRHGLIHIAQRPLNCPYAGCTKTFKREDALKNHLRIHTGEMPFKCEMPGCDMSFPTKAGLRYHNLKHKGEKQCKCSFPGCNKTFLTLSQLKQHESALNYHQKLYSAPNNGIEVKVDEPKVEKTKEAEFINLIPINPKPVEKVDWQFKDQGYNANIPTNTITSSVSNIPNNIITSTPVPENNPDLQTDFEKMVKVILQENNAMKQRISMCSTLMNLMQENTNLKQKLREVSPFDDQLPQVPQSSDDQIYSFLNL